MDSDAQQLNNKWGSRKLKLAVYFEHMWILLLITEVLTEAVFADLTGVTIGGYFLGNVGEWWARRK